MAGTVSRANAARPAHAASTATGRAARACLCLGLAALLLAGSTGCTSWRGLRDQLVYNQQLDDMALSWRNFAWSHRAWHEHKDSCGEQSHLDHYGRGFRAGFTAVCNGGSGCTPALPPREYWSWRYQSGEGQGKVAAWFAGYPYGVRAAEQMGAGSWGDIQVAQPVEGYIPGGGAYAPSEGFRPAPGAELLPGSVNQPMELLPQDDLMLPPAASESTSDLPDFSAPAVFNNPGSRPAGRVVDYRQLLDDSELKR